MILPETALRAIRILGVDSANLMTQMAVYRATIEDLLEVADQVDQRSWEPVMTDDDEEHRTVTQVMLPADQQRHIERILMLIVSLR